MNTLDATSPVGVTWVGTGFPPTFSITLKNILCLKPDAAYGSKDVNATYGMVARNITGEFKVNGSADNKWKGHISRDLQRVGWISKYWRE
jgi:hypothetical protein